MILRHQVPEYNWLLLAACGLLISCINKSSGTYLAASGFGDLSERSSGSILLRPATLAKRSPDRCEIRTVPVSHVCEHETFTLTCNDGEIISVTSALYGRRTDSRCPSGPIYTTDCGASDSLNVVQQRCNGKQSCNVVANNGVFGDPCVGTFKYLEIQYSCEAACCPNCANGGSCVRQNVCECPTAYDGDRCETSVCSPECLNGGRCVRPNDCECPSGYTNNQCQTPVCSPECLNGGRCVRPNDCECPAGYTDNQCQTPICSTGCLNGGRCVRPNDCECPSGYMGNQCQTLTNVCPDDITVPNEFGNDGAVVNWTEVEIVNTNVTSSHSSGEFFEIGLTIVAYHIANATVSATCSFTINVIDTEPPSLNCPPNYLAFADSGTTTMITAVPVYWPPLGIADNSGNVSRMSCSNSSGSEFPIGITEVQCLAFDQSGNNDTCVFQVNIQARCLEDVTNTSVGFLSWQTTVAGNVTESNQRCPVNSERRSYGLASRECVLNRTTGAIWGVPVITSCGEEQTPRVEDLATIPVTTYNVEEVAATLANITEEATAKTDLNIEAVQETFINIVNVGSSSPEVTEATIEIVDHILGANISSLETHNSAGASSNILRFVEQQIVQTLEEHRSFSSVQPNIVVEALTINETETQGGVGFAILSNNNSMSGFHEGVAVKFDTVSEPLMEDVTSSIQLPNDIFIRNQSNSDTKVSFVVYNEDTLFQSRRLSGQNTSLITGPIISAVVLGKTLANLNRPVVVRIFPTKIKESLRPAVLNTSTCVFWDFNKNGGIGDWSEDGCERISTRSGRITCHCNHLTNFAVLVDISGFDPEPDTFDLALDIISKIGCAFSITSLCFTLLIFLMFRRLQLTLPRKILIQFCISLLSLYLVFLVGIDQRSSSKAGCMAVAGLLHYFLLSTVFWMGVEARNMYISLVTVFGVAGSKFMLKASCFAWGLPLIPVVVVLSVKQDDYIADTYCFLEPTYGLYFGLLLPVAMVILHNTVTFVLVMQRLLKSNIGGNVDKTRIPQITKRLKNAFSISVLIGLTWVFGFFAINQARRAFQLLFCVCNSFQGVIVFVLFCISQDDVRKVMMETCFRKRDDLLSDQSKKSASSLNKTEKSVTNLTNPCYVVPDFSSVSKSDPRKDMSTSNTYQNTDGTLCFYEEVDGVGSTKVNDPVDHVYANPNE